MKKRDKKTDDFYINAFSLFVTKFDCAAQQIKNKNLDVSYTYDKLHITNHKHITRNGLVKVIGPQYPNRHWFIPPDIQEHHPFMFMLDGRYTRTSDPCSDIDLMYGFADGTIGGPFSQGFYYEPSYRDSWSDGDHWSWSAAFHLGRHFLNKYCCYNKVKLPCKIPTILLTRGITK